MLPCDGFGRLPSRQCHGPALIVVVYVEVSWENDLHMKRLEHKIQAPTEIVPPLKEGCTNRNNLDYLESPPFNHIIDLPHKTSEAAINWFEEELRLLAKALSDTFQVDTTHSIHSQNNNRMVCI